MNKVCAKMHPKNQHALRVQMGFGVGGIVYRKLKENLKGCLQTLQDFCI